MSLWSVVLVQFSKMVCLGTLALACAVLVAGCEKAPPGGREKSAEFARIEANSILRRNMDAIGGEERFAELKTVEMFLRISTSEYSLDARYRATKDGQMRIDVFAGDDRVCSEGSDSAGVWEWNSGDKEPVNVDHEGVGALQRGIAYKFYPLFKLSDLGHTVSFVGRERIKGINYYAFEVLMGDFPTVWYINPETYLVDRSRNVRALHPAIDDTKKAVEVVFENWKRTDGILSSRRHLNIELATGDVVETADVYRVTYNRPAEDLDLGRSFRPQQ